MKIAGLLPLSLIEYPDKLSAVIFLKGCNFRCGFCQNPDLVYDKYRIMIYTDVHNVDENMGVVIETTLDVTL